MWSAIFEIFKKLAPITAIFLIVLVIWFHGYNTSNKKHIQYVAQIEAQSELVKKQAEKHNADIQKSMAESAKIIEDKYHENSQINSDLYDRNLELLRLRQSADHGSGKTSNDKTTATGSNDAVATEWKFSNEMAEVFIPEARRADEIVEIARSCQAYINSIPDEFFTQEGTQ